jgi:hypothetical protein
VEVMLDGEGGDELFGSRPFYLLADLVASGRLLDAWRLTSRYPGSQDATARHRARVLAHFLRRGLLPPWVNHRIGRLIEREAPPAPLLGPTDSKAAASVLDEWTWRRGGGPRWWSYRWDALTRIPRLLDAAGSLRRTATLSGLRDRHPLMLDQELVELALTIPPQAEFDPQFTRPVARLGQVGRLPDAVRLRPSKSHLSTVLRDALHEDGPLIAELLQPSEARVGEYVRAERLEATASFARSGGTLALPRIGETWRIAALECWFRQLENSSFVEQTVSKSQPPRHR